MPEKKLINFYELDKMKPYVKQKTVFNEKTGMYLNNHCLVVGGTGSGKTNALLNYIALSPKLFSKIIILFKNEEPLYEYLYNNCPEGMVEFYKSPTDIPSIEQLREEFEEDTEKVLFIIDDWVDQIDKHKNISQDYFLRARKYNITLFFLSQSYYMTPKFIRQNVSYIWLVKVNTTKDLNMICSEYTTIVNKEELKEMYEEATSSPMSFLKIDMKTNDPNKKFSINFTDFFRIK